MSCVHKKKSIKGKASNKFPKMIFLVINDFKFTKITTYITLIIKFNIFRSLV